MEAMLQVRAAFDPSGLCNPGKIIPMPRGCGEARAVATHSLSAPTGVIPLPQGEGKGEGISTNSNKHVMAPLPSPQGALKRAAAAPHDRTTQKQSLIATKLNEARIARELARIVGDQSVRRLVDVNSANLVQSEAFASARALEVAPLTGEQAAEVMKISAREDLTVVPKGTGAWFQAGHAMSPPHLILTTRSNKTMIRH